MNNRIHGVRRRSFSLIEVMVVLIIIGLAAGIVGPAVFQNLESANMKAAHNQVLALESSVKAYYLDLNEYPESLEDLKTNPGGSKKWLGPYVDKGVLPKDPWGNDYQYSKNSSRDGISFELYSFGKDGSPGGDGVNADIGNWPDAE